MTEDHDSEDEFPLGAIGVYGELVEGFDTIATTRCSPVILTGAYDGRPALVPFVEINLLRAVDEENNAADTMLSTVVPFENMPHFIANLMLDLSRTCRFVRMVSEGSLKLPQDRVEFSLSALTQCQKSLSKCVDELQRMLPQTTAED